MSPLDSGGGLDGGRPDVAEFVPRWPQRGASGRIPGRLPQRRAGRDGGFATAALPETATPSPTRPDCSCGSTAFVWGGEGEAFSTRPARDRRLRRMALPDAMGSATDCIRGRVSVRRAGFAGPHWLPWTER